MQYPTNRIVLTTAFVKQLWKTFCGMCYSACGMVHIKDTLLLIRKSNQSSGSSGFPLSLPEWSFTIYLMQRTVNVLRVLLNKTFPSFIIIPFVGQNLFITLHTILHYTHRCIIYIYKHFLNSYPYLPRPELCGWTTPRQNMAATAASTALPPFFNMSRPTSEHRAASVATAPVDPICKN